jgi:hypothetical protein
VVVTHPFNQGFEIKAHICERLFKNHILFWLAVSWMLANIMTESSCCFWDCNGNSGHRFCVVVCLKFGEIAIIWLSTLSIRSSWSQWIVMAACHCNSWLSWWSNALLATLVRLWQHFLSCYLWIVVEISLQSHRYQAHMCM